MYNITEYNNGSEMVIENEHRYKLGEILSWYLNKDFSYLISQFESLKINFLYDDINDRKPILDDDMEQLQNFCIKVDEFLKTSPPYNKVIDVKQLYSSNLKCRADSLIKMYEQGDENQRSIALSEFPLVLESFLKTYQYFIGTLNQINGFYQNYLDNYYHDFKYYPKANDIAVSLTKYCKDYNYKNINHYNFVLPNNINLKSTPAMFQVSDGSSRVQEVYSHSNLESLIYREFMACIKAEVMPKRCKNCGKFYIPSVGYFSEFCENIAPNEKVKTCREIGSRASFDKKLKDNPILFEYQKAYKTHHARFVKKKMTKKELSDWKIFATDMRDKALASDIVFDEYISEIKK